MSEENKIPVYTSPATTTRGRDRRFKELEVKVLAENVTIFMDQVAGIMEKTPEKVGSFRLTKFSVSAEISATGQLVLLGTGVEASAKGALVFEFEKSSSGEGGS